MSQVRSRTLIVALAAVTFVTLLPLPTFAAGPCTMESALRTPDARAQRWLGALDRFSAERPGLTVEQQQFIAEAVRFGAEIAALKQNERDHAAFVHKASRIMARSRELFSNDERGALFAAMGETQVWMASLVAALPICNCTGTGACQAPAGGPVGDCKAGCESWDGDDGRRRDGVCSSVAVAD